MCFFSAPEPPDPTRYQDSEEPVYRDQSNRPNRRGRRGTILSSGAGGQGMGSGGSAGATGGGMAPTSVAPKRTILGG